jgi:hypothetical protein
MTKTTDSEQEAGAGLDHIVTAAFEPKAVLKGAVLWLVRLYRHSPKTFALVMASILGLGVLTRLAGFDVLYMIPPLLGQDSSPSLPILRDASWVQEGYAEGRCFARAKALSKPYVLRSVTQWIRYTDDVSSESINVQERIVYDLVPLRNIKMDDQVFLEEYSSSNKDVRHWFGPHRELFAGGNTKYQVQFAAAHGRSVTITTGAELSYKLPLADGRSAFREQATLNHDEDFWVYQNIDDVICSLTQIVESDSLKLSPIHRGGHRVGINKPVEGDVDHQQIDASPPVNSSLGITWYDIEPGEDAGLAFTLRKLN